jgi:hypothetical protein
MDLRITFSTGEDRAEGGGKRKNYLFTGDALVGSLRLGAARSE